MLQVSLSAKGLKVAFLATVSGWILKCMISTLQNLLSLNMEIITALCFVTGTKVFRLIHLKIIIIPFVTTQWNLTTGLLTFIMPIKAHNICGFRDSTSFTLNMLLDLGGKYSSVQLMLICTGH